MKQETSEPFLGSNRDLYAMVVISVLVLAVYSQVGRFQFINFDDNFYVYNNPMVKAGLTLDTIKWAFTAFYAGNWHPLTWLSLAADVSLFGPTPEKIHVVNVALHLIGSLLAFAAFRVFTGTFWASAAIACLFAVHPAHVESVAWIAERKDVLSTVFWFASMWSYGRWCRSGSAVWSAGYVGALAFFALGLMAKPMVVTLPFVLLLCDIWPLERLDIRDLRSVRRAFAEKIPFFAFSAASAVVTILAQRSAGAIGSVTSFPLDLRLENSVVSYAKYVMTAFYPAGLGIWYPYQTQIPIIQIAGAVLLLLSITAACISQFNKRRYLLVGWLWFVGTLVPVIGLLQVGGQSMADRYTYIPYFGVFIMAVFGAEELFERFAIDRRVLLALGAIAIAGLSAVAYVQAAHWRDNETLYKQTLSVTTNNFLIEQNLCAHFLTVGRLDEAETYCRASLRSKPDYAIARNGLGLVEYSRKNFQAAAENFELAESDSPDELGTFANLAMAQIALGDMPAAEAAVAKAAAIAPEGKLPPNFLQVLHAFAAAYAARGQDEKSLDVLAKMVSISPGDPANRTAVAETYLKLKRPDDALAAASQVLASYPNYVDALNIQGMGFAQKNDNENARASFQKALQIKPDFAAARENLRKLERGETP